MTDLLSDVDTPSDAELISRVRGGDVAAYGILFSRHKDAANRLARQLIRGHDADDLVSEAFAKVLSVLQGGGGPDVAFRAYLLTAVRRLHVDRIRSNQRVTTTDDLAPFDPGVPFQDTAVAGFESGAAAKAFASLPERWQLVLWHLEVEGQKPADIAPLLGMSANSVSALAYRAREGLRQAFLTMHLSDISETECRWVNEHLGAFVRKGLAKRDAAKVQGHLDECRRCTAMYLELTEVNSNLAGIIAPLLLGAAAASYLTASTGGVGAAGVLSILSRAKDVAIANTGTVTAGAVASGVAAAAVATVVVTHATNPKPDVVADPGAHISSAAPVTPGQKGQTGLPGAIASPSTSPTTTASTPTLSPSASISVTPTASLTPTESPSLLLLPELSPSVSPTDSPTDVASDVPSDVPSGDATDVPSGDPTDQPTGEPTDQPTGEPTDQPTGEPTDQPTDVPGNPAPSVDALDVGADGLVTVSVSNAQVGDTIGVSLTSDSGQTIFDPDQLPSSCTSVDSATVLCTVGEPTARLAGRFAAGTGRLGAVFAQDDALQLVLPLRFPDDLVEDGVDVTVTINGDQGASGHQIFHPSRTPRFDFGVSTPDGLHHTVDGSTDDFTFTTTARLPQRVAGLRYTLSGGAADAPHFRTDSGNDFGCVVGDDGATYTCPDVHDGDVVLLPISASELHAADAVSVTVAPLIDFADPDSSNDAASVTLRPGAELGLDLSVFSANPDRDSLVTVDGSLRGLRPGLDTVVYDLTGDATFASGRNAGCDVADSGMEMSCPVSGDDAGNGSGDVSLVLRTGNRQAATDVTVTAHPGAPFEAVGDDSAAAAGVTLPNRPTHDFSLGGLAVQAHSVDGDTDRYTLAGTVGDLPAGVDTLDFAVQAGGFFVPDQGDPRCTLLTSPDDGGAVRCTGLATDPTVLLTVASTSHTTHDVTVAVDPADPYDDPTDDPTPDSDTVSVSPGAHLVVSPADLGRLHQGDGGDYAVSTRVSGIRAGLDLVTLHVGAGVSVTGTSTDACVVDSGSLVCTGLEDGSRVDLTVSADHPDQPTDLRLRAVPGGDFEGVGNDDLATGSLVPSYDFSIGDLTAVDHTLSGDTDSFVLRAPVRGVPAGVDGLTFSLVDGGTFADDQGSGCARTSSTEVHCIGLDQGRDVDFHVLSGSAQAHDTTIRLVTPAGYDDPSSADDTTTLTGVRPGIDLHLAALDADNESPANDDDRHLVTSTLSGVRPGLHSVTYTLSGAATFVGADAAGCSADGRTLTCTDPGNGDITFTVEADDHGAATPLSITVEPSAPFRELAEGDNADSVTLLPRPTYDFGLGTLSQSAHTVTGGTDHYTLSSDVTALPDGLDRLGFTVTGATFAPDQAAGCSRSDDTHVTCGDLATSRRVAFAVDSTSGSAHAVTVAVQLPHGYVDPDTSDDQRSLGVTPGVDLSMSALTPSDPQPATGGTYEVSTVLHGVRGPVTFTLSGGAQYAASTCTRTSSTVVTCASPSEGQTVGFTLRPDVPRGVTTASIRASAGDALTELDPSDNTRTSTLAPNVVLESATVTGHRLADQQALVRVQLSGVPTGTSTVRIRLSGAAGTRAGQVHLTDGLEGADGEGDVDCYTSDANGAPVWNGTYATCLGVDAGVDGRFWVDMRLVHPHGTPKSVTFTVLPLGVDENGRTADDSRTLTIS